MTDSKTVKPSSLHEKEPGTVGKPRVDSPILLKTYRKVIFNHQRTISKYTAALIISRPFEINHELTSFARYSFCHCPEFSQGEIVR